MLRNVNVKVKCSGERRGVFLTGIAIIPSVASILNLSPVMRIRPTIVFNISSSIIFVRLPITAVL